jgi:hypothetical protein
MVIQDVLDKCITYVLLLSLIVNRHLARFTPSPSSPRSRRLPRRGRGVPCALARYLSFFSRPLLHAARPNPAHFWCNLSPFRINTCKSVSKQTTLSPFRINIYEKTRGWGPLCFFAFPYLLTSLPRLISGRKESWPRIMSPLNQGDDAHALSQIRPHRMERQ